MNAYIVVIFILALCYTFYMGFSDGANAVATCVATRAIQPRYAIAIAGVVKFVAPIVICYLLGSDSVARTVGSLVKSEAFDGIDPKAGFIFLLSAMIAALGWSVICVLMFGFGLVDWTMVGLRVILMVFLTPVICMLVGFLLSKLFRVICARMDRSVKKAFRAMQVVNVMLLSTSISINNVQKAMGIYLLALVVCGGADGATYQFEFWTVGVLSLAIMLGLFLGGYKLIYTVGKRIYRVGTLQSYVAQLSTAVVAFTCTFTGIPVSTGQVVSSSIIGVGIADKVSAVHWNAAGKIFTSWILTFPVAVCIGAFVCAVLGWIVL